MALLVRLVKVFFVGVLAGVVGTAGLAGLWWRASRPDPSGGRRVPDGPTLVEKVREIARLETLEMSAYKKLTYEVDPPRSESLLGSLASWAVFTAAPPVGRAIVFADVRIGLDLSRIDEDTLRVDGDAVTVLLPPLQTTVILRPGETEVLSSNLDSRETAELLDRGKWAIERDVANDAALAGRARESARRALRGFLLAAGFREVVFVEALPPPSGTPAS